MTMHGTMNVKNIVYIWALKQAKMEVQVVQYMMLCHLVNGCHWVEGMK
jgi:hypothetical protein